MVYYDSICGSRSLDLHIEDSDYDIVTIGTINKYADRPTHEVVNGRDTNYMFNSPHKALKNIFAITDIPLHATWGVQYFYPAEIITNTPLTQYLMENRDDFFNANRHNMYLAHLKHLLCLSNTPSNSKTAVYALYDADMILKFADNDSYTECKTLSEEEKQKYQSVRLDYDPKVWREIEAKTQQALKLRYNFEHQDNHRLLYHYNNISDCMNGTQINFDLFRYN